MKKPRSEMTKKELGKLRYERHYAHVKGKLLRKYKTRPSDVKQDDWCRRLVILDEVNFRLLHIPFSFEDDLYKSQAGHYIPYDEIER